MKETLERIINKFGEDAQIEMMIEECSELIQALQKYKRAKSNHAGEIVMIEKRMTEVEEEIADVKIMMEQASIIFRREIIDYNISYKLQRIQSKL